MKATYFHCASHKSNLALLKASKIYLRLWRHFWSSRDGDELPMTVSDILEKMGANGVQLQYANITSIFGIGICHQCNEFLALQEFLAVQYPCILEDHRLALIHVTSAGARTADHLHVQQEGARTSKDPTSCATAQGAQHSLSFWKLGLMTWNRNETQPLAMPSPEALAPIRNTRPG